MQAPSQEMVNMRHETPMDLEMQAAQETVKAAMALEVPLQHDMESHRLPNLCSMDMDQVARCNFSEGCHAAEDNRDQSAVKTEDLVPCNGSICAITSLYCAFPACIGCQADGTLLFIQQRQACCKPLDCKDENKRFCAVVEQQRYWKIPQEILECKNQCFCLDSRCAIPCNDEVPCLLNSCGLNCMADFKPACGCCKKIGDLIPRLKK
ncbi:unnamed protein product [Amoebophrya sp. A120]|nr:unnamed protein product [Amoebophrya sp. A120]|eukprot:GSA120T00014212001.1